MEAGWPQFYSLDQLFAACFGPVAIWILISGLDDLFLQAAALYFFLRDRIAGPHEAIPSRAALEHAPAKRLAIFLPLWNEASVVRRMIEHNVSAIQYGNYEIFVGVYPNDPDTELEVSQLARRHPRVHLAMCPHDGPTSKADCLNWIYQRMLLYEEEWQIRFEVIVTHDAEDLIHPESLLWINHYADRYDTVQVPVLPLPTPAHDLVHGVYCEEFGETHQKDLRVRNRLGGFVPGCGVGMAFTRRALEVLADTNSNRLFDPECLTEDYEIGYRLHRLGYHQAFLPLVFSRGRPMATREYFPRAFRHAVRQRTRWITGNALQSWRRHGWGRTWRDAYWFWRDRKGLIGNPVSLIANLMFAYGLTTLIVSSAAGVRWGLAELYAQHWSLWVAAVTGTLGLMQAALRAACAIRIYGWRFAALTPARILVGNLINVAAGAGAMFRFGLAWATNRPLVWLKTAHSYPSRTALQDHKRPLGEILLGSQYVTEAQLALALERQPETMRLGEYLVALGWMTEEDVYDALSLQQSLPVIRPDPSEVPRRIARALPEKVMREWKVVPVGASHGVLLVAGPEVPTDAMQAALGRYTRLKLQFQLIPPAAYAELSRALLGA